jgi:hypothetical protein
MHRDFGVVADPRLSADHGGSISPEAADVLPAGQRHVVDLRASAPFPWGRYYVTILAGRERRSAERLRAEHQSHWTRQVAMYALFASVLLALATGYLVILYLIKCALGINVFTGRSPLHFIYELVFT